MPALCTASATPTAYFSVDGFGYNLASMLEANRDDADICAWLREAKIGDEFQAGGGAAPEIVIKRVG
jgi:hypothetical protein